MQPVHVQRLRRVGNEYVHIRRKFFHRLAGSLFRPQFRTVIRVERNGQPRLFRLFYGNFAKLQRVFGNARRNARKMKPRDAAKNLVPVEIGFFRLRDRRIRAVVYHFRSAHRGAAFQIVNAHPVAAARDMLRTHAEAFQHGNRPVRHRVLGQFRYKFRRYAQLRKRTRHIAFRPAVCCLVHGRSADAIVILRRQPQHNFPERYNFHRFLPVIRIFLISMTSKGFIPFRNVFAAQRRYLFSIKCQANPQISSFR